MPELSIERGLDWLSDFGDFIDEGTALVFDVESDPAYFERLPKGLYDVGEVVTRYQHNWLGVEPNHATPLELHDLLLTLDAQTRQLEDAVVKHRETTGTRTFKLGLIGSWIPVAGVAMWMAQDKANRDAQRSLDALARDLTRWRTRLDAYRAVLDAVPHDAVRDRGAVLWSVTAPLFLGWYGGPTGEELEVVGQAPTFDASAQHIADLATPYMLANQLNVWMTWEVERKKFKPEKRTVSRPESDPWPWVVGLATAGVLTAGGLAYAATKGDE